MVNKKLSVDWHNLEMAFDSQDIEWYLNLDTGQVVRYDGDSDSENRFAGDDQYEPVPNIDSREGWMIMDDFVATVRDRETRARLERAIVGDGAFRRFKDEAHQLGVAEDWFGFQRRALYRRAQTWLRKIGIAPAEPPPIPLDEPEPSNELRLYTTARSANGGKPLAFAQWQGIDVDVVDVDVYAGQGANEEYKRLHPDGRVPCLQEGDFVLWESNAILLYLADTSGAITTASDRADIARWLFFESSHWQPGMHAALAGPVTAKLGLGPQASPNWDDPGFRRAMQVLDDHLRDRKWLVGDAPTIADLAVAAMGIYLVDVDIPADFQPLAAWIEKALRATGWYPVLEGTPWQRLTA